MQDTTNGCIGKSCPMIYIQHHSPSGVAPIFVKPPENWQTDRALSLGYRRFRTENKLGRRFGAEREDPYRLYTAPPPVRCDRSQVELAQNRLSHAGRTRVWLSATLDLSWNYSISVFCFGCNTLTYLLSSPRRFRPILIDPAMVWWNE